jgi:Transcription factor WhiB
VTAAPTGAAAAGQVLPVPCASDPEAWWQPANTPEALAAQRACKTRCPLDARIECLRGALYSGAREGIWGGVILKANGRQGDKRSALAGALTLLERLNRGVA